MKSTLSMALLSLATSTAQAADIVIASPDGRVALRIADDASSFSISRRGEAVIANSPLGLELEGLPAFGLLKLESRQDKKEDRVIPLVATKAATARDHHLGATLAFREASSGRRLFIDFSWVKPGKTSWDWWSGPLEGVKPDLAAYKRFINFAAESGFCYHLIDAGWSFGAGPRCATRPTRAWACCCGCTGNTSTRAWTRCSTPMRAGASRASRSTS